MTRDDQNVKGSDRSAPVLAPRHRGRGLTFAVMALTTLLYAPPARAIDVCATLLQPLTVPINEYNCWSTIKWKWGIPYPNPACSIHPVCCTPGLCKASPECGIAKTVYQTVTAGQRYCFTGISASDLWNRWVNKQIALGADVLTGGLLTQLYPLYLQSIDALAQTGNTLPENVQSLLVETLPRPYPRSPGFTTSDIAAVKIVKESRNAFSRFIMQMATEKGGITLGPVVVLPDADYDELMSSGNAGVRAYELLVGGATDAYAESIIGIMHELVHFNQYQVQGRETFTTNYLMNNAPFVTAGYGFDVFEQEAYSYEKFIAEFLGGYPGFCSQVAPKVDSDIDKYLSDKSHLTCRSIADTDGDRVVDDTDNLPTVFNPGQELDPTVEAQFYLDTYGDLQAAFGPQNYAAAVDHWNTWGKPEGRLAAPWLDARFYLARYGDLQAAFGPTNWSAAVEHWQSNGLGEGRASSVGFDVGYYLASYPDLQAAFGPTNYHAAFQHFLNNGLNEGRRSAPGFDVAYYMATNRDLQIAFGPSNYRAGWAHWVRTGYYEGRRGTP